MVRLFLLTFLQTVRSRWSHGPARPSWSFGFEGLIRYLRRDWEDTSSWPFPTLRADHERRPYPQTMVRKVEIRDGVLGAVPARWFVPPGAAEGRVVLFFHGGSYLFGSARTTHADLLARLALASRVTVVGLDYRLAPEHPFPAQLEDAIAAFDALVAGGATEAGLFVAGDSAGGNLALALQLALRDRGTPQAAGAVLVSPWSDLAMHGASFVDNDCFDWGTRSVLERHARAFAGGVALEDPRLSPVHAELEGLAPVFVIAGSAEILRDDILALASRLKVAGVEVALHVAEDMPHDAPLFAAYHPAAQAALEAAAAFVRERRKG